jgi:hypothetical protein
MILNPILMLFLTVLSLFGGGVVWGETNDWRSGIPFLVFIFLFCLSLLNPEMKKAQLVAGCRVALKGIKLTVEWLGALWHYGVRYLAHKRFAMGQARRAKPMVDEGSFRKSPPPAHAIRWRPAGPSVSDSAHR